MQERINIIKLEEKIVKGRKTSIEVEFYKCWCEILDLIGNELYQAINIKLENTIIFKARYCKKLEELRDKKNFIVKFRDRKYKIYQMDFLAYNKKFVKIKCVEII